MTERAVICTQKLVKRFDIRGGTVAAVDGIDLQVKRGETFGLIGPDGAGKTTATRVILGLLRRTDGKSNILGYDSMDDTYAIRACVGYVAQQFALPGDMTVMENIRFFANVHRVGRKERRQRIPKLLEFAGLDGFTSRPARLLSGGMKKKLALACSLVHEPMVVVLDEPTLGVDPVSRREFWNLLGILRAERELTIFVCTPYMDEAERCNRVGLMYGGKLIAYGAPPEVKGLVPGRLFEFAPSDFDRAVALVTGLEGVLEVQTYGLMLRVFADETVTRQQEIRCALSAQGITCRGMREIEPGMEEAFISLVRRARDGQ